MINDLQSPAVGIKPRILMEIDIGHSFIKMEPETEDMLPSKLCQRLPFSSITNPASVNLVESTTDKASNLMLIEKVFTTQGREQISVSGENDNTQLVFKVASQSSALEECASLNILPRISSSFNVPEGCINLHDLGLSSSGQVVRIKCESVHTYDDTKRPPYKECQTNCFHKIPHHFQEEKRLSQEDLPHVMMESTATTEAVLQHNLNTSASAFPTALFQNVYIKVEPVEGGYEDSYQKSDSGLQNQSTSYHQSARHTKHANPSAAITSAINHRTGTRFTGNRAPRQPSNSSQPDSLFMGRNVKPCSIKLERIPPNIAERGSVHLSQQDKMFLPPRQASNTSAVTALQVTLAAIKPRCHGGDRPYKCEQCGRAYKTSSARNQHKKVHIGIKEHACRQCGTSFMYKSSLTAHLRTHTDERPYKCPLCDHAFRWSSHLKTHLVIHSGEKPYKCHICGASYTQNGNLQTHILSHSGERKFVCDVCKKDFMQLTHLQIHSRVHTGERPYKCDLCSAAFAHGNTLTVHKRTHTGERPYKCLKCLSTFTQLPHLKVHMKVHNRPKKEPKVICRHRGRKIQMTFSAATL